MKQLDLGSGNGIRSHGAQYELYGLDIDDNYNKIENFVGNCDLALEPIPFESDMFELVTAYDFLEHIPPVIYVPKWARDETGREHFRLEKRNCMIDLFNEIYRVLKHGGRFYHQTPGYHPQAANLQSIWSDPTHVFVWTPVTHTQLSGDYTGWHDHYGHTSKFKLISSTYDANGHFHETYEAIKPAEPPYLVGGN